MILKTGWLYFCLLFTVAVCSAKPSTVADLLLGDSRLSILAQHLEEANLMDLLRKQKAVTLLAPVNEAFEKRGENDTHFVIQGRKVSYDQLLYHIIPVAVNSQSFFDGQLLETSATPEDRERQLIKVKTSGQTIRLNDAKVIDKNIEAENGGVIHVLNRVLSLPDDLSDTLDQDDDLVEFGQWAVKAGVNKEMIQTKGWTVFATKNTLGSLSEIERAYLAHSSGRKDLATFMKHQIHEGTVYSADFPDGRSTCSTLQGEPLDIVVDKNNQVTVNGVKIIRSDILASNGVIHLLEKPISPQKGDFMNFSLRKALLGLNATKFVNLVNSHGLGSYLDRSGHPTTVLAPPNTALDENMIPGKEIRSWLLYHFLGNKYAPENLVNGTLLVTESNDHLGNKDYQRVRVHITDHSHAASDMRYTKQSIQFGRVGVLGEPVNVKDSIIYPVAHALNLPRDPLSRLPVDLELSTFVASMYASGSAQDIRDATGITIFVPTNEAFGRLGLVTKHLLQPESQYKLAEVVKFHCVRNLYYTNDTEEGEHRDKTLAESELNVNKTKEGLFIRGSGAADGSDRTVIGIVTDADRLINNGVFHKVDRVQLPATLTISNRDLLVAEGLTSFIGFLEHTEIGRQVLDQLEGTSYTILAPSEHAFAKLNLTHLLQDEDSLNQLVRIHIIPQTLPRLKISVHGNIVTSSGNEQHKEVSVDGTEFPTLEKDVHVILRKTSTGYVAHVKESRRETAQVVHLGRSTNGGGVIVVDHVLLPPQSPQSGLSWWKVMLIVLGVLLGICLISLGVYYAWLWWQRREGRIQLAE